MLQIKKAPNNPQGMYQDGNSILRSLQNNSLPKIDLIIRESLQNSLDAQLRSEKETVVDININKFESENLANYFEGIDKTLLNKYPGEQILLAISDKKTKGLTGDFKTNDIEKLENSNFHKLIFGLGKNQEEEGAGGSWGLGKTSYSLIGSGIVIYYTKIKLEDNTFEERLIAALIENPKDNKRRLLPKGERGIAWWGRYYKDDSETIYPITDTEEIERILGVLGLKRYEQDTGTTVIIPYLQSDKEITTKEWESEVRMAVQRWYGPRILNDSYSEITGNTILKCTVNGVTLHPDFFVFDSAFRYVRDLYTSALSGKSICNEIQTKPVFGRKRSFKNENEPIGYLSFIELSTKELKMLPPDNERSLLEKCLLIDKGASKKGQSNIVVAYSRKPGMIVSYNNDPNWVPDITLKDEDSYILAFFVPKSKTKLSNFMINQGFTDLESYLRGIENADHASWYKEPKGITVVKYIREDIIKILKDSYSGEDDLQNISRATYLSQKFGSIFMPPRGFGKQSTAPLAAPSNTTDSSRSIGEKASTKITSSKLLNMEILIINLEITIRKSADYTLMCEVQKNDGESINYDKWKKDISESLSYPFEIQDFALQFEPNDLIVKEDLKVESSRYKFNIEYKGTNSITFGVSLSIKIIDNQYSPLLKLKEVK